MPRSKIGVQKGVAEPNPPQEKEITGGEFVINWITQTITLRKTMKGRDVYSRLQDIFDEPEAMDYPTPMHALSRTEFSMVNGWSLKNRHFFQGDLIADGVP
jgi:hypothetical protein